MGVEYAHIHGFPSVMDEVLGIVSSKSQQMVVSEVPISSPKRDIPCLFSYTHYNVYKHSELYIERAHFTISIVTEIVLNVLK